MDVKKQLWHLMYSIFFSASNFFVTFDEKIVAPPVYASFRRVATSSLWKVSVSTSSDSEDQQI